MTFLGWMNTELLNPWYDLNEYSDASSVPTFTIDLTESTENPKRTKSRKYFAYNFFMRALGIFL